MKTDPQSGALMPFDFNAIHEEFPMLRRMDVDTEVITFDPIDSSNVSPELWIKLAQIIKENYEKFDGFVVLHGTDTMSYSASVLSFMLENLAKPVIFTGSQIPMGVLRTDGRENLITAIEIAAAKHNGEAAVPEVCLYFQNKLLRGNRSKKLSAEDLDAFVSYNYPALAEAGVGIHYNRHAIRKAGRKPFDINTSLGSGVIIIKIFPGLTESVFRAMLAAEGVRAVILETYGAGNAPTFGWFTEAVEAVIKKGIYVMNVTQCTSGSVNMDIYETGRRLQQAGVISGHDITTEAAVAKMMYLLGQNYSRQRFAKELANSLRGEISL